MPRIKMTPHCLIGPCADLVRTDFCTMISSSLPLFPQTATNSLPPALEAGASYGNGLRENRCTEAPTVMGNSFVMPLCASPPAGKCWLLGDELQSPLISS